MKANKKQILEILDSLGWLLDSHDSFAELVEIKDNKVILQGGGQCLDCDSNCIEVAFREQLPGIEVMFRAKS